MTRSVGGDDTVLGSSGGSEPLGVEVKLPYPRELLKMSDEAIRLHEGVLMVRYFIDVASFQPA